MDKKRLFLGLEIKAPWPSNWPDGRILASSHRHMTLAFLGNVEPKMLFDALASCPKPSFETGICGRFCDFLFLPKASHPNVVSYEPIFFEEEEELISYQMQLIQWLESLGYPLKKESFLPHVTIARKPFDMVQWQQAFQPLPFFTQHLHLYESLGNQQYHPIWTYAIHPPFEEIEHTADIAFHIYGKNLAQLYCHAQFVFAYRYPQFFTGQFKSQMPIQDLDDVVIALNEYLSAVDEQIGSPLKAVSFHGQLSEPSSNLLKWEMIVDV